MTEPTPDWILNTPSTPAIHTEPAKTGGEFTTPFTPAKLLQIGEKLLEGFLARVVAALVGVFIPGGSGAAFTQLQAWATKIEGIVPAALKLFTDILTLNWLAIPGDLLSLAGLGVDGSGLSTALAQSVTSAPTVTFDASSYGSVNTGNPTSYSKPHTTGPGANMGMTVHVAIGPLAAKAYAKGFVTVKYNGVALESKGGIDSGHGTNGWLELFTLDGAPGGLHNVVVTTAAPVHSIALSTNTYAGVGGFSGFVSGATNAELQSLAVRGATGGMVVVGMAAGNSISGASAGTQRTAENVDMVTNAGNLLVADAPGADSVTVTAGGTPPQVIVDLGAAVTANGLSVNVGLAASVTAGGSTVAGLFVTRDPATGNLTLGGQRYRFGGANAPFMGLIGSAPAAVAGETVLSDGYHYASHAQIDATLAAAQAFNSNVLTSWGAVQSVGTASSVQPTLGVFNAAALEPTDYCLKRCNELGIKLIVNFCGNYTYETEGSKFWYCTANGVSPDAYATQFFTNTTIINSFKAHISFCLNHVNQYTGVAYKDDPAILALGTGGELGTYPAVPEWPYYAWTDTISRHIKLTCGAQQLVADGHCAIRTNGQDGTLDVNSLTLPYVDMYQLHPYSHFTPPRYSTQEGKICHQYGKAYFIGEFPWQGTEPDMSTPTIWSPTELMSVAKGSTYVDGIQMWELLAPNVTFGGGYTLHWPTPDNSSGHGIPLETARGREMAANNLAMASGKVWPTRLVAVRTAGVQYNSAAYRGGGFNAEGITLYIPEANDIVLVFGGSQGVNTVANAPAGWVNPLGANVGVSSASHTLACMYHVVTTAEAAAANVSYVIANMFGLTANGDGAITVIRGANPASVVDAFATASGAATTTHVLPGLTGASLQDDSMVLSCVSSFANNAYTVPAGTGEAGVSNGHQGIWLGLYDDFTTAGVNVAAKNITAVNSDVYASITLAITGL